MRVLSLLSYRTTSSLSSSPVPYFKKCGKLSKSTRSKVRVKTPKPVPGTQWRANSRSSPTPPSFLKCSRCPKLFSFVISRCCVGCKARGLPRDFTGTHRTSPTVPDPIPNHRSAATRTREPARGAEALPFVRRGRRGLGWDCRHWGSWVAGR